MPTGRQIQQWYSASLTVFCLLATTGLTCNASEPPFLGAYIHMPHLFDGAASPAKREEAIRKELDQFKAAGLRVVMPYATTTSGVACYPSKLIPESVYGEWDPLRIIIHEARKRGLEVYPVPCVLACGKDKPEGILRDHPEWALRDSAGQPTGHISPCHPKARAWVVAVMREIVARYEVDGLLLDYMRFSNRDVQLDPVGEAAFQKLGKAEQQRNSAAKQLQEFKESQLTELMRELSETLRREHPNIKLAIYSWGPHVTKNHRVAQDWETWAERHYVDMVNISGYCYPTNYGEKYLEVFERRIQDALNINLRLGSPVEMTFCLGIRTSHGKITQAREIESYLRIASRLGVDGAAFFTWSYLRPFSNEIQGNGEIRAFETAIGDRRKGL